MSLVAAVLSAVFVFAAVGFSWWRLRLLARSAEQEWEKRFEVLRLEVAEVRDSATESLARCASAEASAGRSAGAAEAAACLAERTASSTERSAAAAERSAGAAEQSAAAASEIAKGVKAIAESGSRAWVHAVEFRLTLKQAENSTLDVSIANLGTTPARELRVFSNFLVCDESPDDLPLKPRVSNIALGPGVSFSLSHFLRVSQADMVGVSTGRKVLLACGKARYRDIFDVERETQWCTVYDNHTKSFIPSAKHNLTR